MRRSTTRALLLAAGATALILTTYAVLGWLGVPAGDFLDWVVALAGFWALLGVVSIPWNLYFGARETRSTLAESAERGLEVRPDDLSYVTQTERRTLAFAFLLHAGTAAGFGALAYLGATPIGWWVAGAAAGSTALRPGARLYRHVASRLRQIGERARFPRDDVATLRTNVELLRTRLESIELDLRTSQEGSWAFTIEERLGRGRARREELEVGLRALDAKNTEEHEALRRFAEDAANRLAEDAQFLGSVREIIRFVKEA